MAFSIRSSLASATRGGLVKPGAPSNIVPAWNSAAAATSTATVTFTAGSPPGLSYTVYATPNGGSATTPIAAVTTGTDISSLTNNTSYTFTVTARRGTLTNSATSTASLSPVGPVTIGAISSITNAGATIAYTAPTGGGTYEITTSPDTTTTTPTSNPMAITGLTGNTSYTFTIKVYNTRGSNSSTSGSYLTIPDKPSIGTVEVTSATVVSVPYTGSMTTFTITSDPSISLSYTNTSATPVSVTGTFVSGQGYTFTITGTNTTGTGTTSSASNSVTPYTSSSGYRYFKFTPTVRSSSANSVQISELIIGYNSSRIDYTGAVASNPGGNNPGSETPAKAIDNSTGTKWLDFNKGSLIIDFQSGKTANMYTFSTANDANERDPVSWTMSGSNDNSTWTTLDTKTNYATTTTRNTQLPWFNFV